MKARHIAAIVLRQIYLLRGSPTRVLPLFAWIAIDVMLWGFITRYLNAIASPGFDFVPAMLGAVLLWDFLSRVMQGVTMAFFEDVWSRNLLGIFASPLSRAEYVTGLVLTGICTSLLGLAVMIVLASMAFGLSFVSYGLAIIPGLMVLFLFCIALGVAGSAMVLRLGPAAEWLIWPLPAVLSPFASVFYPVATLPVWMQPLALALPPSYVFESLRAITNGGQADYKALLLALGLSLVYLVSAAAFFAHVHGVCVRNGLIARYSAESVT
jgi:ABC-2 type transport system permease protein